MKIFKLKLINILYSKLFPAILLPIINFLERSSLKDKIVEAYITCLQMYPIAMYEFCEEKIKLLTNNINMEDLSLEIEQTIEDLRNVQEENRIFIVNANKLKDYY